MKGKINGTGVVIRSFNNPHIAKRVGSVLSMGVGRVVVVTNAQQDKGATKGFLADIMKDTRVELIEMEEGYTWCNALYAGYKTIQMHNVAFWNKDKPIRFVLNLSVETQLRLEHLEAMVDKMTDELDTGVVGVSYKGIKNSKVIPLGASYNHGRNTCMLINLKAYFEVGGFNPQCDGFGGMEDMEFIFNMLLSTRYKYEHLYIDVPIIVGVHYEQNAKEERERNAMKKIIDMWLNKFLAGSWQRDLIYSTLYEMGLKI